MQEKALYINNNMNVYHKEFEAKVSPWLFK